MTKTRSVFLGGFAAGAAFAAVLAWAPALLSARTLPQPAAPGASKVRVVLENDRVRVREVIFPAGVTRTGAHTHEFAHVGVILTEGALVFTEDAKSETVKFAAGDVGFREAKVTHDVGNPGARDMRVIEVELKR